MMTSWPFFRYFFKYIFHAKTRQRLLFIAVTGLFLSTLSLLVIQGVMGGLQHGLISRSKSIHGHYILKKNPLDDSFLRKIKDMLRENNIPFYSELEIEVMLKRRNFVAPAKIHGINLNDDLPPFIKEKDFKGLVFGSDLSSKLKAQYLDDVQVIAPGVYDSLMGEVPRFLNEELSDYLYTELMEVDEFEMWSRSEFVQNLIRQRNFNQIRIFGELSDELASDLKNLAAENEVIWQTWEEMNESLVWSLNLENKVMLFLFISMSLLVAISITSGLMIFYSKMTKDLMSFWILGMPQKNLVNLCFKFTVILSGITCFMGGFMGYLVLRILESYGHILMPDIFIERQIPVQLNFSEIAVSFFIPFGISLLFSYFSFAHFRKENQSFVSLIRSLS